jgi:putative tricarboxylic transport membrane protein
MAIRRFLATGLSGLGLCALLGLGWQSAAHAQDVWKPNKPVELVVQSAPGGGTDITARLIQKIIESNRLLDVPVTVVNKPGGGGNVALAYLNQKAGDGHYLQIASAAVLTSFITGNSQFNYTHFSPIAQLNSEYIAFGVKADSPIKNGKDLLAALARDPASVSVAIGTASGGVNHAATAKIAETAGADPKRLKAVVFKSSSESATALLGGHVNVAASSASILLPYVPAQIRLIGVTSPQSLGGALANVPTWKEQGVDVELDNFRMVMGPPKLSPAQVKFWEATFSKILQSDDWKKDLETQGWTGNNMSTAEFVKSLDRQFQTLSAVLASLGMAQKPPAN